MYCLYVFLRTSHCCWWLSAEYLVLAYAEFTRGEGPRALLIWPLGMCHRTAHGFEVLRLKQRTTISLFCISGCLCRPETFWLGLDVGGPRCTRKGPTLSCIYLSKIIFYNVSLKYKTYNSACVMKLMMVMRKALLYLPDQPLRAFAKHPFQEIIFKFLFSASPPPASIDFWVDGLELAGSSSAKLSMKEICTVGSFRLTGRKCSKVRIIMENSFHAARA